MLDSMEIRFEASLIQDGLGLGRVEFGEKVWWLETIWCGMSCFGGLTSWEQVGFGAHWCGQVVLRNVTLYTLIISSSLLFLHLLSPSQPHLSLIIFV